MATVMDIWLDLSTLTIFYTVIVGCTLWDISHYDGILVLHYQLDYIVQISEQPSPLSTLPSSHTSIYLIPSPHIY